MDSKLTLNVDKDLAEKAKVYAKSKGRSLSDLVENFFKVITSKSAADENELISWVKRLRGSYKLPEDFNYKKELTDRLSEKYL
ncbi:MAG TPA: hypothetical protein ENI20_05600 [Bacteroides sp.]|nr:hypothetical protein [Bacteroides sp.]